MRKVFLLCLTLCLLQCKNSPDSPVEISTASSKQPKLVVGIVIDQMRFDYLTRFESKFVAGGFKRLMASGYHFKNAHFNYVPTYTGPGHASIYTGTAPMNHRIVSNNWYDKFSNSFVSVFQIHHKNSCRFAFAVRMHVS